MVMNVTPLQGDHENSNGAQTHQLNYVCVRTIGVQLFFNCFHIIYLRPSFGGCGLDLKWL